MRKTIEIVTCDITGCKSDKIVNSEKIQVIFTTEQTEGRNCPHHLYNQTLDLCSECKKHLLKGHYIFASGAMGFNEYWFDHKP